MQLDRTKPPMEMSNLEVRLEILRLRDLLRYPMLADSRKVVGQIERFQFLLNLRENGIAQIPPQQLQAIAAIQKGEKP